MHLNVRGQNGITEFSSRHSPSMTGPEWEMFRLTVEQTVPLRHRAEDSLLKYEIFGVFFFRILQMIFRTHADLKRAKYCLGWYPTINNDDVLCNNVFQSWENIWYSPNYNISSIIIEIGYDLKFSRQHVLATPYSFFCATYRPWVGLNHQPFG